MYFKCVQRGEIKTDQQATTANKALMESGVGHKHNVTLQF